MRRIIAAAIIAMLGSVGPAAAQQPPAMDDAAMRDFMRLVDETTELVRRRLERQRLQVAGQTLAAAEFLALCPRSNQDAASWTAERSRQRIAAAQDEDRQVARAAQTDAARLYDGARDRAQACQVAENIAMGGAFMEIGEMVRAARARHD